MGRHARSPIIDIKTDETWSARLDILRWASTTGVPRPRAEEVWRIGDETSATSALRLVGRGRYLLYRGHFVNAMQLLAAMRRRIATGPRPLARVRAPLDIYRAERERKRREHDVLGRLVVLLERVDYRPMLDGAAPLGEFGAQAWGPIEGPILVPLREWVGARGAREWYRKGVEVPALGGRVHPRYGVFAPIRGEYVDLVAEQSESIGMTGRTAYDIGTGTGVLAFVLARRGASRVVATDADPRAVACARDNAVRLSLGPNVEVLQVDPDDPFPNGSADVLVCNPPWVPVEAPTPYERSVFDPDGRFLRRFLDGSAAHLNPGGQAWLVLSDFAERVGLRPPDSLAEAVRRAGLVSLGSRRTHPSHDRAADPDDPLHSIRSQEVVSLHVLGRA
jgi:predicted RNA methylase